MKTKQLFCALLTALCLGGIGTAHAQSYPSGPIKIIVPFTAGSATDILARTVGERLSPALGQPVIVENRPGAGGTIGINLVAKATADGLTLSVVSTGHVVNHVLYPNIPYDTIKDLAGVAPLATLPSVLIVPPSLGAKTVKDLVALAKSRPGQFNYGTAGVGTTQHLTTEAFALASGAKLVHVPQKGSAGSMPALLGSPRIAKSPCSSSGRVRARRPRPLSSLATSSWSYQTHVMS